MIIAIDGYEANVGSRVGISRYAYAIISYLNKISQNHTVRIYIPEHIAIDFPHESPTWRYLERHPKKLWTIFGLPKALFVDLPRADVVFSPTHYIPRFTSIPRVMSVMDLSFLHYPELFRPKDLYQLQHWTRYSVQKAMRILTISQYSKRDIIDQYKIPEERIVVTYPGLSLEPSMTEVSSLDSVKKKFGIVGPYILSVGTLQPRKNYVRLIEAYAGLVHGLKKGKKIPQLIIVGKKGWLYSEILKSPQKFNVSNSVVFLDFIDDRDLVSLYKGAICFALPSLYEGFGLPVLEAMANKCQVVVSATSSLPEIAGSSGIYVRPENVEDIQNGLLTALNDYGKARGRDRINKGLEQVKKFTWENAAEKTLDVLEAVGKGLS